MMTFTYILLWVLIGIYACGIIYNHKLKKGYEKLKVMADGRTKSADSLYEAAKEVLEDKPKIIAYDEILDAAEERHHIALTGEVLTSDLNRDFYKEVESILLETQEELNK